MPRRLLRYALDVVLLCAVVVVFLTGLLVDRLDLHQFAVHRWAGYVLAGLVAVHVAAHWRFFLAPSASRRRAATPPQAGAAAGAGPAASEQVRSGPTRRAALAAAGAGAAGAAAGWFAKTGISPDPYGGGDVGLFYHQQSSLGPRGLLRSLAGWGSRPAPYKHVAGGAAVALPAARPLPGLSVGQALYQRRSLRRYRDRMLTGQELAWLVHAATAITSGDGYRTAPSAGALYPIETYVAVSRVQGIDAGLFHVDVRAQALEPVRAGPVAGDLMIAGLGQEFLRQAPAVFVLTGVFQRRDGSTANAPTGTSAGKAGTWPRTSTSPRKPPGWERAWSAHSSTGCSTTSSGSTAGTRRRSASSQSVPVDTRQCAGPASPAARQPACLIRRVPAISSRSTAWARPGSPSSCCPWAATAGPTRGRAPQAAGRPPRRAGRRRNALSRPCGPPRRVSQRTPCETITLATVRDRTGCSSCSPPPRSPGACDEMTALRARRRECHPKHARRSGRSAPIDTRCQRARWPCRIGREGRIGSVLRFVIGGGCCPAIRFRQALTRARGPG